MSNRVYHPGELFRYTRKLAGDTLYLVLADKGPFIVLVKILPVDLDHRQFARTELFNKSFLQTCNKIQP